jgi:hypothetical protein
MPADRSGRDVAFLVDALNAARECAGYVGSVDFATSGWNAAAICLVINSGPSKEP